MMVWMKLHHECDSLAEYCTVLHARGRHSQLFLDWSQGKLQGEVKGERLMNSLVPHQALFFIKFWQCCSQSLVISKAKCYPSKLSAVFKSIVRILKYRLLLNWSDSKTLKCSVPRENVFLEQAGQASGKPVKSCHLLLSCGLMHVLDTYWDAF